MKPASRVLVVDDERFFREAIREVLDGIEVKSVLAATGREALDAAGDESIGVVILDIQLPDMSGLEVFRQLRDTRIFNAHGFHEIRFFVNHDHRSAHQVPQPLKPSIEQRGQ